MISSSQYYYWSHGSSYYYEENRNHHDTHHSRFEAVRVRGLGAKGSGVRVGARAMTCLLKGLYWEPQIGNPKNIAGI